MIVIKNIYAWFLRNFVYHDRLFTICQCESVLPPVLSSGRLCKTCPEVIYLGNGLWAEK